MNALSTWQNFYVIVGSAGGALIGVQFVVIALVSSIRVRVSEDVIHAFVTPTIVHFSAALAISAIGCIPWPRLAGASIALAVCGIGGLLYTLLAFRRAKRQTAYQPVAEDWLWYVLAPGILYVILMAASALLVVITPIALFVMGSTALALLFVGIHNAWDSVIYLVATPHTEISNAPAK